MSRGVIHKGEASPYPHRKKQLFAIAVSLLAAIAMASYLKSTSDDAETSTEIATSMTGPIVGEIQSLEGTVQVRPPKSTRFLSVTSGPLVAEAQIQTQSASAAVIEFRPGPTIRLQANSRLIAELDPSRDGVINATLLAGEFTVLNPGTSDSFTISQNGIPLNFREGPLPRTVPLIPVSQNAEYNAELATTADAQAEAAEKMEADRENELSTVSQPEAPQPLGTPNLSTDTAKSATTLAAENSIETEGKTGLVRSTLTNDDIRSQVKSQAGSLQKCYVAMVNRMSESAEQPGQTKGELPRGEVRVAFKILSTGKVEEPKVLKSPFRDQTFERCTAEALGRMRFRAFQGPTIRVGDFQIVLE